MNTPSDDQNELQPRVGTRRLVHHWPFRESVVEGRLVRNLPPLTERQQEARGTDELVIRRKR